MSGAARFDARYCGARSGQVAATNAELGYFTCTEPPGHGPVVDPDGQRWAHAAAERHAWWGDAAVSEDDVDQLAEQLREVADQCADVVLGALERHRLDLEQYDHAGDPFGIHLPEHPLKARDRNGRPVLADVLAGRAQALAALLHLALEQRR